jgi:hypothetical protein
MSSECIKATEAVAPQPLDSGSAFISMSACKNARQIGDSADSGMMIT